MKRIIAANVAQAVANPAAASVRAIRIRAFGEDRLSRRSIRLGRKHYKKTH